MNPPSEYASIEDMLAWARNVMRRSPDVVIGSNYLRRWWITPRNAFANVYLHEFRSSDDDRALHDHPWANSSLILSGRYIEHTSEGQFVRQAGDFVQRESGSLHRIELIGGHPVISLFTTGPKVRDWGFDCPQGWVPWQEFTDPTDPSKTGRGCGEFEGSAAA
jgi:hypothetical protein